MVDTGGGGNNYVGSDVGLQNIVDNEVDDVDEVDSQVEYVVVADVAGVVVGVLVVDGDSEQFHGVTEMVVQVFVGGVDDHVDGLVKLKDFDWKVSLMKKVMLKQL